MMVRKSGNITAFKCRCNVTLNEEVTSFKKTSLIFKNPYVTLKGNLYLCIRSRCFSAQPAATNTSCKRRSLVCFLLLQLSNLYLQPAEFIVRAAPAQCSSYYWCVYLRNGNGLSMEVSSITPGVCSVNMPEPEADTLRDCLELRWERLALLIRACGAADRWRSSLWPLSKLHGRTGTAQILKQDFSNTWASKACSLSSPSYFTFPHNL